MIEVRIIEAQLYYYNSASKTKRSISSTWHTEAKKRIRSVRIIMNKIDLCVHPPLIWIRRLATTFMNIGGGIDKYLVSFVAQVVV